MSSTNFLFSDLKFLPKIGPKISAFLERLLGARRIVDLLYHKPFNILKKKYLPKLYEVNDKDLVIVKLKVESYIKPYAANQPFRVRCYTPTGYMTIIFFKVFPGYIEKNFVIGTEIAVSGKVDRFNGELQMSHPDYVVSKDQIDLIPKIEVIYPLAAGLNQKLLRAKIAEILEKINNFSKWPEWIDGNLFKQRSWPGWKDALHFLHNPKDISDLDPNNKARKRLAYDELFASQIASAIAKKKINYEDGRSTKGNKILRRKLLENLPFKLTSAQEKVLAEIDADMASGKKMLRLLQGDVGSGKTIIALLSALSAAEEGKQTALIVPISLLADQHFQNISKLTGNLGIKIAVLTGKNTKKQKKEILEQLKNGEIHLLIGTHALIYEEVIFKDLALIIIDEQHRFGVLQRLELVKKGIKPDVLLMSATPIPRSLMMTLYSDMDISILNEKPQNRLEIDTRIISQEREEEILAAINRAIQNKEKIYWICPLIEETEEDKESAENEKISNVSKRFSDFTKIFPNEKVGLIHGKMKEKEKEKIMEEFVNKEGKIQILIATTVIEVGIDVRDATVIIIENPEKFGLSQLHQLRGRVGRGDKKSYCILLYGRKIGENGKKRLSIMRETNDGFKIAEEDLKLRGFGEIFGTRQSGLPEYKIANLAFDADLLSIAGRDAGALLNQDPNLQSERGKAAEILLKIFNYDECIKMVHGG